MSRANSCSAVSPSILWKCQSTVTASPSCLPRCSSRPCNILSRIRGVLFHAANCSLKCGATRVILALALSTITFFGCVKNWNKIPLGRCTSERFTARATSSYLSPAAALSLAANPLHGCTCSRCIVKPARIVSMRSKQSDLPANPCAGTAERARRSLHHFAPSRIRNLSTINNSHLMQAAVLCDFRAPTSVHAHDDKLRNSRGNDCADESYAIENGMFADSGLGSLPESALQEDRS